MAGSRPRERVLRRMLRLVDISRDLDRNRSDGDFCHNGGELLQVLDENIFEMFLQPYRHTEAVRTFYDALWADEDRETGDWRGFEAQAALLTAEFLIGRATRERTHGSIVLTEHHRFELAKRVEELADQIRVQADAGRKRFRRDLATKIAVAGDLELGRIERSANYADGLADAALARDLDALGAEGEPAVVERFRLARIAAAFLAQNELLEPLEQLRRVGSYPIRQCLRTAQGIYPMTGPDRASVEADADRWYERIVQELRLPGHRSRLRAIQQARREASAGSGPDSDSARSTAIEIRNDARSIAYLRWVARNRIESGQRLVFVTGDAVVFDAYRRWFIGGEGGARDEPFFLRRAVQYSPMFNPVDSGSDLSASTALGDQPLLFNMIQQALEAALLPITQIDEPSTDAPDPCFNPARERLALKLIDCEDLGSDDELASLGHLFTDEWLESRSDDFSRITSLWQEAHRVSIGASFDLIRQRSGGELREAARVLDVEGEDASTILSRYITGVLDQIIDDSLQLWLPIADTFEAPYGDQGRGSPERPRRVTLALGPSLRSMHSAGTAPEDVFAAAAVRALEQQDVMSGQRFANLAARADKVARSRGSAIPGRDLDLRYLQAVAYRMQILSIDSLLKRSRSIVRRADFLQRGAHLVRNLHFKASQLIEQCIVAHATSMDDADDTLRAEEGVKLLRGLSERASLNLFTATSLGLAARITPSPLLEDWHRHLLLARGDLKRCLKLDDELALEGDAILSRVRAQFIPNIAAYEVLAYVLHADGPNDPRAWPRKDVRRVWDFWSSHHHIHPLLRVELEGYAALLEEAPPQGVRIGEESPLHVQRALDLPLDRALYSTIRRELPMPTPRDPKR
jgi:hypothetical protein